MRRRAAVALSAAAFGAWTACQSFGAKSGDATDPGADAGAGGASMEDGSPDGTPPADAGSDDVVEVTPDGGCARVVDVTFDAMPPDWSVKTLAGTFVFDTAQTPGGAPTLHSSVSNGMIGGYAYLEHETPVSGSTLASVTASYSFHVQDWGLAYVEAGCSLAFDRNTVPTSTSVARIVRQTDGTVQAELDDPTTNPHLPLVTNPAPGWYDATITVSGITDGKIQMVATLRPRTLAQKTALVSDTIEAAAVTNVSLRCGLMGTSDGAGSVDTWVDHATMDVCH